MIEFIKDIEIEILKFDKINIKTQDNVLFIKRKYFFKILVKKESKLIYINYSWNIGIIGKIVFNNIFQFG